jgi:nuclear pore complex protein Nup205
LLQNLETDQKRSLLCQELERIKTTSKLDAKFLLGKVSFLSSFLPCLISYMDKATLEMLLLLVWRHVEYYAEPRHMNMPPTKTTVANAMRLLATSEPAVFQADVRQKIAPVLQKLEFLDLVCFLYSNTFFYCFDLYLYLLCRMTNPLVATGRITRAILRLCVDV